jgi:hypothetical protein
MEHQQLHTAGAIAKERLETYLEEKLGRDAWDLDRWNLYTYLLKQAKNYKISSSGFASTDYQRDSAEAAANCRRDNPERF